MKILQALESASRYYRAAQGARITDRRNIAALICELEVFSVSEVAAIANVHRDTVKKLPEAIFCSDRKGSKFNPSSIDTFIIVRRALLAKSLLQNGMFVVLWNDGNSLRTIETFTGVGRSAIQRRINGSTTSEWYDHGN